MGLRQRIQSKLKETYRFIIVHNETYQQAGNYTFTVGRLVLLSILLAGFLIIVTSVLIVFTPLREFIPGYTDSKMQADHLQLMEDMDKLKVQLALQDSFMVTMQHVFREPDTDSLLKSAEQTLDEAGGSHLHEGITRFINPVQGKLQSKFDPRDNQYGIELAVDNNATVSAAADGMIIFAEYSKETGHVLMIQHAGNLVTVYKHNNRLLKKTGDYVFSGEAIAAAGAMGELAKGTRLRFEVWEKGKPQDPLKFVSY
ncbi:MAG: M23 family metallopeptidase [Bacteroidetes bacterium]|nr:M23 family metallopeptidase [Bacteroidota bacterium]